MIELTVLEYLNEELPVLAYMEVPEGTKDEPVPERFVVIEKTGSGCRNHVSTATFAIQSYAGSLAEAAKLNEDVIKAMQVLPEKVINIGKCELNSDYNYTDASTKQYRYQAVFDLSYVKI